MLSICTPISPVILKPDVVDSPKLMNSEDNKKSRRSILSSRCNKPYNYQKLSFDEIKKVYSASLLNQNKANVQDVSIIINMLILIQYI